MAKLRPHVPGLCALLALSSLAGAEGLAGNPAGVDPLRAARSQLDSTRARSDEVTRKRAEISRSLPRLEQQLTVDSRALYRLSRNGMLPMTLGLEGLLSHASRVQRMTRMVKADLASVETKHTEDQRLLREASELEQALSAASTRLAALEGAQRAQLTQQIESNLSGGVLQAPAAAPAGSRMNYGLSVVGGMAREKFTDQQGNLALPVSGPSSIADASRAESGGPGLEFSARHASPVRVAAAGRVAFSDRYGSYGQLVIIDHGDRYYTVYGGLGSVEVQVGDELSKSARLGTAGSEAIYFEVRRGTKTENARPWLGL
jgi:murein DD-endopeptidase MepM/ murein hydrolase activator NlpD